MNKYFERLCTVLISLGVFMGIPIVVLLFSGSQDSWWLLSISWIPALITFFYLDGQNIRL